MANAFQLEERDRQIALVTFDLPGKKVNTLGHAVLSELAELVGRLGGDPAPAAADRRPPGGRYDHLGRGLVAREGGYARPRLRRRPGRAAGRGGMPARRDPAGERRLEEEPQDALRADRPDRRPGEL